MAKKKQKQKQQKKKKQAPGTAARTPSLSPTEPEPEPEPEPQPEPAGALYTGTEEVVPEKVCELLLKAARGKSAAPGRAKSAKELELEAAIAQRDALVLLQAERLKNESPADRERRQRRLAKEHGLRCYDEAGRAAVEAAGGLRFVRQQLSFFSALRSPSATLTGAALCCAGGRRCG